MDANTQLASDVHFLAAPLRFVWRSLLWLLFFLFAPLLYSTVPFLLVALEPHADFSVLALVCMALGPFAASFWMILACHWPTVRQAQREGRLDTWREDAGGFSRTLPKSIAFMFLGLFGSAAAEAVFCSLFSVPSGSPRGVAAYFAAAPFATFAPVLLLWLLRRARGRKR